MSWQKNQYVVTTYITRQAAENYMCNSTRKYLLAKVVLFPEFGFSGIPRAFES